MAKSKNGGTRSYLRGRIASDVYSIGKDSKGNKQQVVRSLAETVANPQTTAQMRGRMIMSTVMQAVSGLSQLIDHSFDNVAAGQPSISEFIRRNYALIKADVTANPASDNKFGLNKYGEKGAKAGQYVIAAGPAILPSIVPAPNSADSLIRFNGINATTTAKQFRDALGLGSEDYLTVVTILDDGSTVFYRLHVSDTLADDTVVSEANALQLFNVDNPFGLTLIASFGSSWLNIMFDTVDAVATGYIVSRKVNGKFIHNDSVMFTNGGDDFAADVALATYPVGSQKFLNGGELDGASSSVAVAHTSETQTQSPDNGD